MFKTYSSSSSLVITSRWFATSRLRAPVSVRLVYYSWVGNHILPDCHHRFIVNLTGTTCYSWWCHQMEPFSTLLALCAGNSPVTDEFPAQWPVKWNFDVIFDLRLKKWLSKQSRRCWFKPPSHPLWHHCNVFSPIQMHTIFSRNIDNKQPIAHVWVWVL